jgi:hypothetical protein
MSVLAHESEKARVFGVIVLTLGMMAVMSSVMTSLGLNWIWGYIYRLPFWLGVAASIALWGGGMLAFARLPRMLRFVLRVGLSHGPAAVWVLARGLAAAVRGIATVAAVVLSPLIPILIGIARIFEPFYLGLLMAAQPLLAPLAPVFRPFWAMGAGVCSLWRRIAPAVRAGAGTMRQRCREEGILWRAYRKDFRTQFGSYWQFRRAFAKLKAKDADAGRRAPHNAADPFADACSLLGLRPDGNFSEAEFKASYRASMKAAHPDIVGPNDRAGRINAASMVIKKRKGWL